MRIRILRLQLDGDRNPVRRASCSLPSSALLAPRPFLFCPHPVQPPLGFCGALHGTLRARPQPGPPARLALAGPATAKPCADPSAGVRPAARPAAYSAAWFAAVQRGGQWWRPRPGNKVGSDGPRQPPAAPAPPSATGSSARTAAARRAAACWPSRAGSIAGRGRPARSPHYTASSRASRPSKASLP